MKSEEIRTYFQAYLDSEMNQEEKAEFLKIIENDIEAKAELISMQNIINSLHDLPEQPLPDGFPDLIHQRLTNENVARPLKKRFLSKAWLKPLAAVAVLLLFVAVANSGVLSGLMYGATNDTADSVANDNMGYSTAAPSMDMGEGVSEDRSYDEKSEKQSMEGVGVDGEAAYDTDMSASVNTAALGNSANDDTIVTERKVIKNTDISIETEDYDKAFNEISTLAKKYGGYVVSGYTNNDTDGNPDSGYLSIRVESGSMDTAVTEIRQLGDVKNENFYGEDVTSQYVDVESRLKQYRIQESRLLDLFDQATTVTDMITIESELTRVRSEIESLEGQIRYLTQVTDLSLINVDIIVPNHLSTSGTDFSDWHSFWQKLGASFVSGINFVAGIIANLIFVLGYILPILIVLAILLVIVWLIIRAVRKKK